MKKILVISTILLIGLNVSAQKKTKKSDVNVPEFKMVDGKATYSGIVTVIGAQKVLYDKGLNWVNSFYKNPGNVLKEKVENNKIVGKAEFSLYAENKKTGVKSRVQSVGYTITISLKDEKYKYDITRIHKKAPSYYGIENWIAEKDGKDGETYSSYLIQVDEYMQKLIKDLNNVMSSTTSKKSGAW